MVSCENSTAEVTSVFSLWSNRWGLKEPLPKADDSRFIPGHFYSIVSEEDMHSSEEELMPSCPPLYFFTLRMETNFTITQPFPGTC